MRGGKSGNGGTNQRSDVGYKRPPKEHQFKKGQKPPLRKRKPERMDETVRAVMTRLLQEERRVTRDGKLVWLPTNEIILRKAFEVADGGSTTIQRILIEIQFAQEPHGPPEPKVVWEPNHPASEIVSIAMPIRPRDAA